MVLEKTLDSPLDYKEIKLVNPEGNQPWIFIGKTERWSWSAGTFATLCEEPIHCKDLDARKDWVQKEKEVAEDKMVR